MKKVVLAFSGGLDTTYCAVWLREQGYEVHTVTVHTGGFDADELAAIERRARQARVASHVVVDARPELFDDCLRFLIFANAQRGGVYPLCVSAERMVQARAAARHALKLHADAVAHGSTAAGNDQVRFDVAFRALAPAIAVLAPIREQALSREQETDFLVQHGIQLPAKTTAYSINRGLWGVTIGGRETHRSDGVLPDDAWVLTANPGARPTTPQDVRIAFERGIPVAIDNVSYKPVALVETLGAIGAAHGVGRGMHVGDTILGIKGRVAFEAPAAVTLVAAHRELEKLVLSRQQLFWKNILGDLYGGMVHEARFLDPLMQDIEAFLASSQRRVTGTTTVRLFAGQATVLGAESPCSLMNRDVALYGESSKLWDGAEAAAFCKIYGMQDVLLGRVASSCAAEAAR